MSYDFRLHARTIAAEYNELQVNKLRWAEHVIRRPAEAPLNKVFKSDFVDGKICYG
jgi:hypothetical protein